jgi:hypothetical protein
MTSWRQVVSLVAMVLATSATGYAEPLENSPNAIVADHRPPNVPAWYVITPHGYFEPSCVIEIANDEHLDRDNNIVGNRGRRPCRFANSRTFTRTEAWPG